VCFYKKGLHLEVPASAPESLRRNIFGSTSFAFDHWSRPWVVVRLGSQWSSSAPPHTSKRVG